MIFLSKTNSAKSSIKRLGLEFVNEAIHLEPNYITMGGWPVASDVAHSCVCLLRQCLPLVAGFGCGGHLGFELAQLFAVAED